MNLKALALMACLLTACSTLIGMNNDARNRRFQRSQSSQDLNGYGRRNEGLPTGSRGSYQKDNQTARWQRKSNSESSVGRRQHRNQKSTDESPFDYLYGVASDQGKTIREQWGQIEHLEQKLEMSEKLLGTLQDKVSSQEKQIATLTALCGRLCEATGIQEHQLTEKDIPITSLFPFLSPKEMETWKIKK